MSFFVNDGKNKFSLANVVINNFFVWRKDIFSSSVYCSKYDKWMKIESRISQKKQHGSNLCIQNSG